MTSRLDRLFVLLENGSSSTLRYTAAKQLGEVAKCCPAELDSLLNKLHSYLRNKNWSTRVAASQAIYAIAAGVPLWCPVPVTSPADLNSSSQTVCDNEAAGFLALAQIKLDRVVKSGARLYSTNAAEMDENNIAAVGRVELNQNIGMNDFLDKVVDGHNQTFGSMFTDEDMTFYKSKENSTGKECVTVESAVHESLSNKRLHRSVSQNSIGKNGGIEPPHKIRRLHSSVDSNNGSGSNGNSIDVKPLLEDVKEEEIDEGNCDYLSLLSLEKFCSRLVGDLWQEQWEVRHGAATGLRELLRVIAPLMGKRRGQNREQMNQSHRQFLEDTVVRTLVTLALDQLSDFVSDEVVAPVRESCAQVLGVACLHLSHDQIVCLLESLLVLSRQDSWMISHGGLLGSKYVLAARQDLSHKLLPLVLSDLYRHLTSDTNDDIRAAAACCLASVASSIPSISSHDQQPMKTDPIPLDSTDQATDEVADTGAQLVPQLWKILAGVGELSTATNALMNLLCELNDTQLGRDSFVAENLEMYLDILVVFMYHTSFTVREAAVKTLTSIIKQYWNKGYTLSAVVLSVVLEQCFQRVILESRRSVLELIEQLWRFLVRESPVEDLTSASMGRVDLWLCLTMQPSRTVFSAEKMLTLPAAILDTSETVGVEAKLTPEKKQLNFYIAGSESLNDGDEYRESVVMESRVVSSKLLAQLFSRCSLSVTPLENNRTALHYIIQDLFISLHLSDKLATPRLVVGLIISEWCLITEPTKPFETKYLSLVDPKVSEYKKEDSPQPGEIIQKLAEKLDICLEEIIYYEEILGSFKVMQRECRVLINQLEQVDVKLDSIYTSGSVLNLDQCRNLIGPLFDQTGTADSRTKCRDVWTAASSAVDDCTQLQTLLQRRVQTSLSTALVHLNRLSSRLNPVIRPLMECLRRESWLCLQQRAGLALARLLVLCCGRTANPTAKIVKNITNYYTQTTPDDSTEHSSILALHLGEQIPALKPGRTPKNTETCNTPSLESSAIQKRGANIALTSMVQDLEDNLESTIPPLWDLLFTVPSRIMSSTPIGKDGVDDLLTSFQVLELCLQNMRHQSITKSDNKDVPLSTNEKQIIPDDGPVSTNKSLVCVSKLCPSLLTLIIDSAVLTHSDQRIRHHAARCLATLAKHHIAHTMNLVLEKLLPLLGATDEPLARMGIIETLFYLVEYLELKLLPYAVLLVARVLARMSDSEHSVRLLASRVFADLLRILPLESSIADPEDLQEVWIQQRREQRIFLDSLLHPKTITKYALPIRIKTDLREYQQEGVNWLAFLNRYNMHGILCDDLGLGKTIQTICILAGDHHYRAAQYESSKSEDCRPLPSLVVCPSTLTGHWNYEVDRFVDKKDLRPLIYAGSPDHRVELQSKMKKYSLIIASYEIVRNDIEFFSSIYWNYVVLDEGHVIRNAKAKLARSIKSLPSAHRLALTGTPIQNNVIELWSLFDFLMPGFLGSEAQFTHRYGRPVNASRDAKASAKDQQQGALALEALHRQVLPFMLRRMKEDVLHDLPPKIIQDYHCELTPLQSKLYEAFNKSSMRQEFNDLEKVSTTSNFSPEQKSQHVFQALQYLRKVCNHPDLALSQDHPMRAQIVQSLAKENKSIGDIDLSGKLKALKQLLLDCGLGSDNCLVNQHRILIFCQVKAMLSLVEKMITNQLPKVTFLRLDGSVPANQRHELVMRFNHDPSIDILLLTTAVGGLGLNLTGADTVIFVEHDWNPMKDLQAMDRAHRIGQRRVVNVYRLITSGTLEDKIMSLQKFKLGVANTVVTSQNQALESMDTAHLFDLFELDNSQQYKKKESVGADSSSAKPNKGLKSVLDGLSQLWNEEEYKEEYDLKSFVSRLPPQ